MPNLKDIRKRISSVRSTQQVTKAMKMVAAAKLRRAQEAAENARAYSHKLTELLCSLATSAGEDAHPLLRAGSDAPLHAILISADRGLCGGYNANMLRTTEEFLDSAEGAGATLTVFGRRGFDHVKKRDGLTLVSEHVNAPVDMTVARALAAEATERFLAGESGGVMIAYTRFRSAISQLPVVERLLPVAAEDAGSADGNAGAAADYVYEPNAGRILATLLPRYVETRVYHAMLESSASEHGSRMTAMDSATNNASDMIDRLTLEMNRARQASITTELMEIVGGAEALKG
ncbi:MAG: ATP synthase F1 subunit gamma [Myxococcales bacterium]|nr:MAG: ATP synthase F1 subunit gamma [Myxococcales bacterium]